MSDFDQTNRGSIWKNERKSTDKHPDFTGSLNVDGKEYWVSAWKRRDGAHPKAPALSFSIQKKDGVKPIKQMNRNSRSSDMNDEIPF
jgi:hypothetical protein